MNIDDYVYAAVLSHIGWQQIATGNPYKRANLYDRLSSAIGVDIPASSLSVALARMANEGFVEIIETGVGDPYFKLKYKPINEYILSKTVDKKTAEYVYRNVGKQILLDQLNEPEIEPDDSDAGIITGPPPALTEEHRSELVTEIGRVAVKLDTENLSNEVKAQTLAYLTAAKALAESPEPPTSMLWDLVERASQVSGIAALFVAMFALFSH